MSDNAKTKKQLIQELQALRQQVAELQEPKEDEQTAEVLRGSEVLYASFLENLRFNIDRKDLEGWFTYGNAVFCKTILHIRNLCGVALRVH